MVRADRASERAYDWRRHEPIGSVIIYRLRPLALSAHCQLATVVCLPKLSSHHGYHFRTVSLIPLDISGTITCSLLTFLSRLNLKERYTTAHYCSLTVPIFPSFHFYLDIRTRVHLILHMSKRSLSVTQVNFLFFMANLFI